MVDSTAPLTLRSSAVLILATVGLAFVAWNWVVLIQYLRTRKHTSTIPVIGGLLLAVALALAPNPAVRIWFWLPLFVDPACIPLLVAFVWRIARRSG